MYFTRATIEEALLSAKIFFWISTGLLNPKPSEFLSFLFLHYDFFLVYTGHGVCSPQNDLSLTSKSVFGGTAELLK